MENQNSIYLFLDIIGGMLGPVIGVMLAHYFCGYACCKSILMELYTASGDYQYYDNGFNLTAFFRNVSCRNSFTGWQVYSIP